jgi:hypothetical protein
MKKRHENFLVTARPYLIMAFGLLVSSAFIMFKRTSGADMSSTYYLSFLSAGLSITGIAGILYFVSSMEHVYDECKWDNSL